MKEVLGMVIFVNFEKAIDTISWTFQLNCLETFNFGNFFWNAVKPLYTNILTCVTNNGHARSFFKPERGISQGCPLSARRFLLVEEIRAISIKDNHRVSRIKIGKTDYKITQMADETTLFIADLDSLGIFLFILEIFRKCTGLKINWDKSEAMWIGASSNFRHKPRGLKWTDGLVMV